MPGLRDCHPAGRWQSASACCPADASFLAAHRRGPRKMAPWLLSRRASRTPRRPTKHVAFCPGSSTFHSGGAEKPRPRPPRARGEEGAAGAREEERGAQRFAGAGDQTAEGAEREGGSSWVPSCPSVSPSLSSLVFSVAGFLSIPSSVCLIVATARRVPEEKGRSLDRSDWLLVRSSELSARPRGERRSVH